MKKLAWIRRKMTKKETNIKHWNEANCVLARGRKFS